MRMRMRVRRRAAPRRARRPQRRGSAARGLAANTHAKTRVGLHAAQAHRWAGASASRAPLTRVPRTVPAGVAELPANNSIWNGTAFLPSTLWSVPGCRGAHEGEWPSLGADSVWMCAYAGSGSYRWALQVRAEPLLRMSNSE